MTRPAALLLLVVAGCNSPLTAVSEAPIPVSLAPGNGLWAQGAFEGGAPFPLLLDTGTVLTARSATGQSKVVRGRLRLSDRDGVPRADFRDVPVLASALAASGLDDAILDLSAGGILGGDLLQRFSVRLDYGANGPSVALLPGELACSCALADGCRAVLPFTLAGGGTYKLGDDVLTYPPTRVTLDACLQPVSDPMTRGKPCVETASGKPVFNQADYDVTGQPGVDVRLLVATGFPGILLGAGAWDRLDVRDAAGQPVPARDLPRDHRLYFPGRAAPVMAARATLGSPAGARAALALVDRLGLLGACAELSRSRRIRAYHATPKEERIGSDHSCDYGASDCPAPGQVSCLQCLQGQCNDARGRERCNDRNQPAAAYIELAGPIPIFVADDAAPILQEANFDVRPGLSDIEGVVGTELLARLSARIDYPNSRIVASCAGAGDGCTTWPRYACPGTLEVEDCGRGGQSADQFCNPPSALGIAAGKTGPVCLGAPIDRR